MSNNIPESPGLSPVASSQGWFTPSYWSALFSSFFASLGGYFWTSSDPLKSFPFPRDVTLSNVQEWLGKINFETNLNLVGREVEEGPTDQTSRRIDDLKRVVTLVAPHITKVSDDPIERDVEDWTPISELVERVGALEVAVLKHQTRYLPIVEGPPPSAAVQQTFGLRNPHNNCFMNATLQMIFSSPFLVEHIVYGEGQNILVQQVYEKWKDHFTKGDFSDPYLANVLRSLHASFEGRGQHDANEFLMALVAPLKKEDNPLFFRRKEMTKYKDLDPKTLVDDVEAGRFEGPYKVCREYVSTVQLHLPSNANCPLIDELIEKYYTSGASDLCSEGTKYDIKERGIVRFVLEERKFLIAPPPLFLFVDLVRHGVTTQQFSGGSRFRGAKKSAEICFQQFFYIPPEQTLDGRGAKYEWISYAVQGGSFSGGHYTANVKHASGIHYYSDSTKLPRTEETFLREGRDFYLGFARRVDCDEVVQEMREARLKGETDKKTGAATAGKFGESKMLGLIRLFSESLDKEHPDLHELQKIYDLLDDPFRDFVAIYLPERPREHLVELKAIDQKLGTELSGNIVAQYAQTREQNIRIARDLKREKAKAEAMRKRLEHLSTIGEDNERLQMAKILDPELEKVLPTIPVETLLEINAF